MLERAKQIARRMGLRRFWRKRATPGNYFDHDASPEAIAVQVEYALGCGRAYAHRLNELGVPIKSASVLEIGPGVAFGAMAYLRAYGASIAVADEWLAPWRDGFHGAYYTKLREEIEKEAPNADLEFLSRIIRNNAYDDNAIRLHFQGAENLEQIAPASVDAIFSNAVLEHLADPGQTFAELFRITRPGGYGAHQVDFRDHRDFTRPLEHLLLSPKDFAALSERVNREYGSQRRQSEYDALVREAGFAIVSYESNTRAEEHYLDEFEPRLRQSGRSSFAQCPRATLADLSGLFVLRRP